MIDDSYAAMLSTVAWSLGSVTIAIWIPVEKIRNPDIEGGCMSTNTGM